MGRSNNLGRRRLAQIERPLLELADQHHPAQQDCAVRARLFAAIVRPFRVRTFHSSSPVHMPRLENTRRVYYEGAELRSRKSPLPRRSSLCGGMRCGWVGCGRQSEGVSMQITKVRIAECSIPLPRILRLGPVEIRTRDYVVISIETEDGVCGEAIGYPRGTPLFE